MARKLRQLPANLYERNGEYYYRRGRKTYLVGTNRQCAIEEAIEANLRLGLCPAPEPHAVTYGADVLSAEAITERSESLLDASGVYFLLHEGRIVYVGQSMNCWRRIGQHESDPAKRFDAFYVIRCEPPELDRLEAVYIAKFQPPLNAQLGSKQGWEDAKAVHRARFAPKSCIFIPNDSPRSASD